MLLPAGRAARGQMMTFFVAESCCGRANDLERRCDPGELFGYVLAKHLHRLTSSIPARARDPRAADEREALASGLLRQSSYPRPLVDKYLQHKRAAATVR